VLPDGTVRVLDCDGLALGIERGQTYEQATAELPPGAALVLYTDGVIEARRSDELFGEDRMDAIVRAELGGSAQAIADAVVSACRAFAGGELSDDCAIVVLKKT
jgi:serine phosphatase RsbU (regulator of sigma subunit)